MPLQIPHPNKALHLYRHLLREATYLPPLCRPWTADRIKTKFRDYRSSQESKYIKQAHHNLRYLRAANAGHFERMLQLCYHATGRLGKRRRQLVRSQLAVEAAVDTEVLQNNVDNGGNKKKSNLPDEGMPDWLHNYDVDLIIAVAKGQYERQTSVWPRNVVRSVDYMNNRQRPTENCWGVPFSDKQVRRKLRKHYAKVLGQLMPPVPEGEWEALKALATGTAEDDLWTIPPRRPIAVPVHDDAGLEETANESKMWDWEMYATKRVRALERKNSRSVKALTGEEDDDPRGHGRPTGIRAFKPRLLRRRLYGQIWETSATVSKDTKGKWAVTWGGAEKRLSAPSASDLQFFAGVNAKGQLDKSTVQAGIA